MVLAWDTASFDGDRGIACEASDPRGVRATVFDPGARGVLYDPDAHTVDGAVFGGTMQNHHLATEFAGDIHEREERESYARKDPQQDVKPLHGSGGA